MTPHDQTENLFGKIRGRFDEVTAQQAMLDGPDRAISAIACLDDRRLKEFIAKFNDLFGKHAMGGMKIVGGQS